MKFSIILIATLFAACSQVDGPQNSMSESDRIIRVYDTTDNLLTENMVGNTQGVKVGETHRIYDAEDNLQSEEVKGENHQLEGEHILRVYDAEENLLSEQVLGFKPVSAGY